MNKSLRIISIGFLAVVAALLLYGWWLTRPQHDAALPADPFTDVAIAPPDEALTLARSHGGTVYLVTGSDTSGIHGIDLNRAMPGRGRFADAIAAYNALGAETLRQIATNGEHEQVAWEELAVPINARFPHIAAGTNFRAHAAEVGHDGEPFLFPKLSDATPWNAPVREAIRLDHEVELCAVPFENATAGNKPTLGYLLCGDFTDRWQLVANIDLDGPMGLTGFPAGKGGASRMPVGALLVVPDNDTFYQAFDLNLYVNGRLRQRAEAGLTIWNPRQIVTEALANCEAQYLLGRATLALTPCQHIPARTILLTGTPEGVLFHIATLLNPWAYLRSGDEVVSTSRHLGILRNTVR